MNNLRQPSVKPIDDLSVERIEVPEWHSYVFIRKVSGAARDAWRIALDEAGSGAKRQDAQVRLAAFCIVDNAGRRVFADSETDELAQKNSQAIGRVCEAALSPAVGGGV